MPSMSTCEGEKEPMSYVLGITGGIATGKSTVVKQFAKMGFPVVDGDLVARKVVAAGTPGLDAIATAFGKDILTPDGTLDRKKLGEIVFKHEEKKKQLDQLLDPFIREEIKRQIEQGKKKSPLVIADIPLLFEADYVSEVDAIGVVYVPFEQQLIRLMARDGYCKTAALQRINSQWTIEEKRKKADIIFDNTGSVEQTRQLVMNWVKNQEFL